jgi:hypothetical protein
MEQIIDAAQSILYPEFLSENALSFFGSQRADAVGLCRLGQETRFERFFLRRR